MEPTTQRSERTPGAGATAASHASTLRIARNSSGPDALPAAKRAALPAHECERLDRELLNAAETGDAVSTASLLAQGADVDAKNVFSETALKLAAAKNHPEVMRLLISNGADVDAADDHLRTPLMMTCNGRMEAAQILIENHADVHARDDRGRTALIWAASEGACGIAELLIANGADMNAVDNTGMTPLMWAANNGRDGPVALLLERGADPDVRDDRKRTASDWADMDRHHDLADTLRTHEAKK